MKRIIWVVLILAAVTTLHADIIMLKDEQIFEAEVKGFDSYYVELVLSNGKEISIPWQEIKYIKHTTTPSSWLEQEYITQDEVEVGTLVSPLSPDVAFQKALFPGFITHGAGHFYAKDYNAGMSLMSAEIVSVILMGVGIQQLLTPEKESGDHNIPRIMLYTGTGAFLISWLYDIIFSPQVVKKYNSEHTFLLPETINENSTGK